MHKMRGYRVGSSFGSMVELKQCWTLNSNIRQSLPQSFAEQVFISVSSQVGLEHQMQPDKSLH